MGLLGLVAMFLGCSQPPVRPARTNNLVNVDCRKHDPKYAGKTTILVNGTNGIAYEDEIVFVCPGENVHWEAASGSGVKSIEVRFLNNEWPFTKAFEPLLHGDAQTPTPDLEVGALPPNFRAKSYKYQIHVMTSTGVLDLDPHIIKMGGGP
jgi:hypothetical protein